MDLPGELMERLSDALRAAYPSYAALEQLLRFKLGLKLAEITTDGDLSTVVFKLLTWAESTYRVEQLFEKACEHNNRNKALRRAYHLLLVHAALAETCSDAAALKRIADELSADWAAIRPDSAPIDQAALVKAIFKLVDWVDRQLNLVQLVTTALRVQGSHAGLQQALAAIAASTGPRSSHTAENARATDYQQTDYQQIIEHIAALLKQQSYNQYLGETFKAFIQTLQLVGDSLRQAQQHQPVEAFDALAAALAQLREESALAAQVRVGDYQSCFRLAAEDDEKAVLTSFIDLGFLKALTGDPARPASAIVLGDAGHGKTSYCRMLARSVNQRALVVTLPVDPLLLSSRPFSRQEWLSLIRMQTITALSDELKNNFHRRKHLAQNIPAASAYEFARNASGLAELALDIQPAPDDLANLAAHCADDLLRWLELLAKTIASGARYESVYLLVDVKEHRRYDTGWLFGQLQPLLQVLPLVYTVGFAFKLFLPARLKALVEQVLAPANPDIQIFELTWGAAEIENMLSMRLSTHDLAAQTTVKIGPVAKFAHLCEDEPDFLPDRLLVEAALEHKTQRYSPRKLMALAWAAVNLHLARYPEDTRYINAATIESILEI